VIRLVNRATSSSTIESVDSVVLRLATLFAPVHSAGWSVNLVSGQLQQHRFVLRMARMPVVRIRGTIQDGRTVTISLESLITGAVRVAVLLGVGVGALLTFANIMMSSSLPEFGIAVAVPLLSGCIVILVTFLPAFALISIVHRPRQSDWLLAFLSAALDMSFDPAQGRTQETIE
jgi:hypothetical protein